MDTNSFIDFALTADRPILVFEEPDGFQTEDILEILDAIETRRDDGDCADVDAMAFISDDKLIFFGTDEHMEKVSEALECVKTTIGGHTALISEYAGLTVGELSEIFS